MRLIIFANQAFPNVCEERFSQILSYFLKTISREN